MQILEVGPGRINGFGSLEETLNLEMRCLGRIRILVVHSSGIRGIEFWWMQILEENSIRIKDFGTFVETITLEM